MARSTAQPRKVRYVGKARRLTPKELQAYLENLSPEEARSVVERWKAVAARKDLLHFEARTDATIPA